MRITLTSAPDRVAFWFVLLSVLTFVGEALGYAACRLIDAAPPQVAALAVFAGVAAVVGGAGAAAVKLGLIGRYGRLRSEMAELRRDTVARSDVEREAAGRVEHQQRLRHDLRGALSPALLTADRLLAHADPKVKRAGEIMVKSVERASALLIEPDAEASPPADP